MMMMCWFYCIPLAKALFFGLAPMLVIFALFVLKRGIRQSRPWLRQAAFLLMFGAILKLFTLDFYLLRKDILCGIKFLSSGCGPSGFRTLQMTGLAFLVAASFGLFNIYRSFCRNTRQIRMTPEEAKFPLLANLSFALVMLLILWAAAPWLGYLTVGHVPPFFMGASWQYLAALNLAALLAAFWKLEDCSWAYITTGKKLDRKRVERAWTPRDTLWTSAFLFLIALALSYMSSDVLSVR